MLLVHKIQKQDRLRLAMFSDKSHAPPLPPRSAWYYLPGGAFQPLGCWR